MEETEIKKDALWAKIQENKAVLRISRLPQKTLQKFIELAEAEFCSDYGMTLKFLLDNNEEVYEALQRLEEHEQRLTILEQKLPQKEETQHEKVVRMVNGMNWKVKK